MSCQKARVIRGLIYMSDMQIPGQRWDSATGISQNYFRDYDPSVGRYLQSDPIGLAGGASTYGYVGGSPFVSTDFYGLDVDINLFPENSKAYMYVKLHQSDPTECTIAGHGTPHSVGNMSPRDISELISKVPACKGKKIRILACNAGVSPKNQYSFAQRLANIMLLDVYAPSTWGWLDIDGSYSIHPTKRNLPWTVPEAAAQDAGRDRSISGAYIQFSPTKKK